MSTPAPERVPTRMTIDYVHGYAEVKFADGPIARAPLSTSAAGHIGEIVRSDYDPISRELTVTLAWGAQATVDIGHGTRGADRDGRPVVYLDQNHWVALACHQWSHDKVPERHRDPYARLFAMARDRMIILPISAAHLVETARSDGRWRRDLATTMLQLSRGWQMRSPLKVRHHEIVAAMAGERPVDAPPVFALEPGALFASEKPAVEGGEVPEPIASGQRDTYGRLTWVSALVEVLVEDEIEDDAHATAKVERWRSAYEQLATHMDDANIPRQHVRRNAHASLLADLTDDLAWAAATVGLSTERFEEWIADAEERIARMPYLGRLQEVVHRRLRNAQERWCSNDLNDMHFLSCAAGYADVMVGEKHISNHIRNADRDVPSGAFVCLSPAEAVDHLDTVLA